MPVLNVQANIMTEMQKIAEAQIRLQNRMNVVIGMWSAENMNTLIDADVQSFVGFAHVTAAELAAAKNAMDTISTAIGSYGTAGTPALKLLRIVNGIPD